MGKHMSLEEIEQLKRLMLSMPETPEQFGQALEKWRTQTRSDRDYALEQIELDQRLDDSQVWWSAQTLEAIEAGRKLPHLRHAAAFDRLYGAGGWVEMGLYSLYRNRWHPWTQDVESVETHNMVWPARYKGEVWVKIKPLPEHVDEDHCITVLWGAHRAAQDYSIPEEGLILVTGGGPHHIDEGVHRFILNSDLPIYALFGAWDLPEDGRVCSIDRELKQRPRVRRRN